MMLEGTLNYTILALVPVVEAFGFADEIRKKAQGLASPQLKFEGFEMLDQDPFWEPRTQEELEDLGEFGDKENQAKLYTDAVRIRKGLRVEGRKYLVDGNKNSTLRRT